MWLASVRTWGILIRCPLSPLQGKWQHQLSGGRIYPGCSGKDRKLEELLHCCTHMHVNLTGYESHSHSRNIHIQFYGWFLLPRFTLKRDEKTWKVWTAQDPSESVTSWLIWQRHASSASSHTVGWKAAKMAEKNGEGGGGKPRSSKSSTSSRKLKMGQKWGYREKGVRTRGA